MNAEKPCEIVYTRGTTEAINLVAFSRQLGDVTGHVLTIFVIAVAAAEVAVGLALIVEIFKSKRSIDVDQMNSMKG